MYFPKEEMDSNQKVIKIKYNNTNIIYYRHQKTQL